MFRTRVVAVLVVIVSLSAVAQELGEEEGSGPSARQLWIRSFPEETSVSWRGEPLAELAVDGQYSAYRAPEGALLAVDAPGYYPYSLRIADEERYEVKLEPRSPHVQLMTQVPTGRQPKSVTFSPDGRFMVVAELEGTGLAVYDAATGEHLHQVVLGGTGFVETLFLPGREELWVSQMIGGLVHVISTETWEPLARFWSGGNWSKVLIATADERTVFLSNWISEDVSVIDAATRTVSSVIECDGVPRGLALSPDERSIYVANYDTGFIEKRDVATGALQALLGSSPGAKRHLVADYERERLYASDMLRGTISVYSFATDQLIRERYLGPKLNTIALDRSGRFLFVSDRGPNNPVDYTIPGPEFGKVTVVDAVTLEPLVQVWGHDQPTGLDVSSSGTVVVFTNFLDYLLELYRFTPHGEVLLQR